MSVEQVRKLHIGADGVAELRTDRVKQLSDGTKIVRKAGRVQTSAEAISLGRGGMITVPPGCRVHYRAGRYEVFVVEQPPTVRTVGWKARATHDWWRNVINRGVAWKNGLSEGAISRRREFQLAFPYTVFLLRFEGGSYQSTFFYFRTEPLRSLDDQLYHACITNYYETGEVCMGTQRPEGSSEEAFRLIPDIIRHFWNAGFNTDLSGPYTNSIRRNPELITPWDWEVHSLQDRFWPLRGNWSPFGKTLRQRLKDLAGSQRESISFNVIAKQVRTGPKWHNRQPVDTVNGFVRSASLAMLANGRVIELGQRLRAQREIEGIQKGRELEIEHFFEPNQAGRRAVKFEDVEKPLLVTEDWWHCFQSVEEEGHGTIQFGEHRIGIGSMFRLKNTNDVDLQTHHRYKIVDMQRDADGDILVRVDGHSDWCYLSTNGEPYDSVLILNARFENQKLSFDGRTIAVGDYIKINSISRITRSLMGKLLLVEEIEERTENGEKNYYFRFKHQTGVYGFLVQMSWQIEWGKVVYDCEQGVFEIGGTRISIAPGGPYLITGGKTCMTIGRMYEGLEFRQGDEARSLDVDLHVRHGNESVPVIRDGNIVIDLRAEQAVDVCKTENLQLQKGMRLKCLDDTFTHIRKNEILEVLCFAKNQKKEDETDIIFADGRWVILSVDVLQHFAIMDAKEQQRDLTFNQLVGLSVTPFQKTGQYKTGELIEYKSQNRDMEGIEIGSLCVTQRVNRVERWDGNYTYLDVKPLGTERVIRRISNSYFRKVAMYGTRFDLPKLRKADTDTKVVRTDIDPSLFEELERLENKGYRVRGDRDGHQVHIGDFVRILERSFRNSKNTPYPEVCSRVGLVVHHSADTAPYRQFVYILYADKIKQSAEIFYDTRNIRNLPARFLGKERGSKYAYRVTVNLVSHCQLLQVIEPPVKEVPKPPKEPDAGDYVRVIPGVTPTNGWGSITANSVGVLEDMDEDEVCIRFPEEEEWIGRFEEIEVAPLQPGMTVQIDTNNPYYGWGRVRRDQQGTVSEILSDQCVIVAFDTQERWHARTSELLPIVV